MGAERLGGLQGGVSEKSGPKGGVLGTGKTRGRKRAVDGRGNCPPPDLSCQLPGAYGIGARWSLESRLLDNSRAVTLQSLAAWVGSPGRWL